MTKKTQFKTTNYEMSVLWKKEILQKYSKESLASPALGSGDGAALGAECSLCGAAGRLQLFTEDNLDRTLCLYFGVEAPPGGVICESCVKCVRITERFSGLVRAACRPPPPPPPPLLDSAGRESPRHTRTLTETSPCTDLSGRPRSLWRSPSPSPPPPLPKPACRREPKRGARRPFARAPPAPPRRMNVACSACGRKYPATLSADAVKWFLCSRCRMRRGRQRDTAPAPAPDHNSREDLRRRTQLRGKSRLYSLPKKPQQLKPIASASRVTPHSASGRRARGGAGGGRGAQGAPAARRPPSAIPPRHRLHTDRDSHKFNNIYYST